MRSLITVSALALLVPVTSLAANKPGLYDIAGLQQICLVADHTWYGTTFSGWGGGWRSGMTGTNLYGNYDSGAGNDSIVLGVDNTGIWEEWRDDGSFQNFIRTATLTYIGKDCPPPAAQSARQSADPSAR